MRVYPKRLKGLNDLKREKELLQYKKEQTAAEDFFPKIQLGKGKSSKGVFSMISSFFSSGSGVEKGIAIAEPLIGILRRRRNKKRAKQENTVPPNEPHKNIFKSLLIGIFTGYLKWKAIEVGARLIIGFIKPRKK